MTSNTGRAVTLLDGGLGQELIRRSARKTAHPLWSLQVMLEEPDLVSGVHRDFCLAGARVLCPNTYTATRGRLGKERLSNKLDAYIGKAYDLLGKGIAEAGMSHKVSIQGSLPPLIASYVADVAPSFTEAYRQYRELIALQQPYADFFILETMSNIIEAQAGMQAMADAGLTGGAVAFTLDDNDGTRLRSGETLHDAMVVAEGYPLDAVLVNCSKPEAMTQAMPLLSQSELRFGGYANGFTAVEALVPGGTVDALTAREDVTPDVYVAFVEQWLSMGASIVGGCCEIGPAHIKAMHDWMVSQDISISHTL